MISTIHDDAGQAAAGLRAHCQQSCHQPTSGTAQNSYCRQCDGCRSNGNARSPTDTSLESAQSSIRIAANNLDIAATSVSTASQNLKVATSNAQSQLYNQMMSQGRELQLKFMDMFVGKNATSKDDTERVKYFQNIIIAYYVQGPHRQDQKPRRTGFSSRHSNRSA